MISKRSGNCKRGRQKGVSLICSDLLLTRNQKKSEQIGTNRGFPKTGSANRNRSEENGEIGTNRGDPLLPTPKWGLERNGKYFRVEASSQKKTPVLSRLLRPQVEAGSDKWHRYSASRKEGRGREERHCSQRLRCNAAGTLKSLTSSRRSLDPF